MQKAIRHAFSKAAKVRLEGKEPFSGIEHPSASLIGYSVEKSGEPEQWLAGNRSPHVTNMTKINVSRKWHESVADIRKLGRRENRLQQNAEKHESGGSIGQTDNEIRHFSEAIEHRPKKPV